MSHTLTKYFLHSAFLVITSSHFIAHSSPLTLTQSFEHTYDSVDVATGDLNGDGYSDIFVVSNDFPHKIYFNNAQSIFTPSSQSFELSQSSKVVLEDFDNDGDLDAWVGIRSNNEDQIYINDGNGFFTLAKNNIAQISTFRTYDFIAGDIDNDGDIDVLRSSLSLDNQFLYRNNGSGEFTEEEQTVKFYKAALADYDNDGYLDIWTISGSLKIFLNDQNGNFDNKRTITAQDSAFTINIKVADIDGDGDMDVQGFTESLEPDYINPGQLIGPRLTTPRYINNSDGTFNLQRINQLPSSGSSSDGLLIDLDNDSDLDLWAAGTLGRDSVIWMTNEDGFINSKGSNIDNEQYRNAVASDDFNNDGLFDVVSVGLSGNVNIRLNLGNAQFSDSNQPLMDLATGITRGMALIDANQDGKMDFVTADTNGLSLYTGYGNNNFIRSSWASNSYADIEVADFNQDDFPDIIAIVGNTVEIWLNNTNSTFSKIENNSEIDLPFNYSLDVADYDKDGDMDILLTQLYESITIWNNNGQNEFTLSQTIYERFRSAIFVDLNNNGNDEILTISRSNTLTYHVFDLENGVFSMNPNFTEVFETSTVSKPLVTFDIDNDGDMDVVSEQKLYSDGITSRYILINQGDAGFERVEVAVNAYRIIASGDFNDDGHADLLGISGHVYLNDGINNFSTVPPNNSNTSYEAIVADFDNDGDVDVASRSNEALQIFQNSTIFVDEIFDNGFEN